MTEHVNQQSSPTYSINLFKFTVSTQDVLQQCEPIHGIVL